MSTRIVWPDWMPIPVIDGYGVQPTDRRIKTQMDIGGVYRVEFDTDESTCSCSLELNYDQAAWFEAFEYSVLNQGATWFEMPLRIAGEVKLHVVRFSEHPQAGVPSGEIMPYTMVFDISKRKLMCKDEAEAMLIFPPSELRALTALLCPIMNEQAPGCTNIPWPLVPPYNPAKP